jgi:hypothetical protein
MTTGRINQVARDEASSAKSTHWPPKKPTREIDNARHARHSTRSPRCGNAHRWTQPPRRPSELAGGAVQTQIATWPRRCSDQNQDKVHQRTIKKTRAEANEFKMRRLAANSPHPVPRDKAQEPHIKRPLKREPPMLSHGDTSDRNSASSNCKIPEGALNSKKGTKQQRKRHRGRWSSRTPEPALRRGQISETRAAGCVAPRELARGKPSHPLHRRIQTPSPEGSARILCSLATSGPRQSISTQLYAHGTEAKD